MSKLTDEELLSTGVDKILNLLPQASDRIDRATSDVPTSQLYQRTENEPWSVHDILAHLRAFSDVWADTIYLMLEQDDLKIRYVSPRSFMKQPKYAETKFDQALESFKLERVKLIQTLIDLDLAEWQHGITLTNRKGHQTIFSYVVRLVNHEQAVWCKNIIRLGFCEI